MKARVYTSQKWLEKRLHRDHKTVEQIAAECGVSKVVIYKYMKRYGLK